MYSIGCGLEVASGHRHRQVCAFRSSKAGQTARHRASSTYQFAVGFTPSASLRPPSSPRGAGVNHLNTNSILECRFKKSGAFWRFSPCSSPWRRRWVRGWFRGRRVAMVVAVAPLPNRLRECQTGIDSLADWMSDGIQVTAHI